MKFYALKKPSSWIWAINGVPIEDVRAKLSQGQISKDWLICEVGSGNPETTLAEFTKTADFSATKVIDTASDLLVAAALRMPTQTASDVPECAIAAPALFSRESGWATFFKIIAVGNFIAGLILAASGNPVLGIVAGLSSCLTCLFFAFVSQLLVDIRWLLSRR